MIETERVLLRRWRPADARAYKAIASHPAVARTLGKPPTLAKARATVATQNALLDATGSCFWALEMRATGAFGGWCGIKPGPDGTPVAGVPEIGWTLHPDLHGRGLATEAAGAVLAWAWAHTEHPRVYAITTPGNAASLAVMRRLGMAEVPGSRFEHPALAEGDPLRPHVTYAIERP
jgi:RimJ/RimL family protein N-acetyltransferase